MDLDSSIAGRGGEEQNEEKQLFHVLAVDDSHIDRKLLERLLTVSSYQVTCVDSGDKALEYLGLLDIVDDEYERSSSSSSSSSSCSSASKSSSQHHQDQQASKVNLIMTDYSMPGISGYDLLKRIKDSSWKDVPVVVMSSENVPSRINMCLEGGAEEFLLKPVKLSDLRKLHSHLLNNTISTHPCNSICNIGKKTANTDEEDTETVKNCISNSNRRKTMTLTTSSDLSGRRPSIQQLPVFLMVIIILIILVFKYFLFDVMGD